MKTTLLVQSGVYQIVMEPENEFEDALVKIATKPNQAVSIMAVSKVWADCRGRWLRQFDSRPSSSLVLRVNTRITEGEQP